MAPLFLCNGVGKMVGLERGAKYEKKNEERSTRRREEKYHDEYSPPKLILLPATVFCLVGTLDGYIASVSFCPFLYECCPLLYFKT